MNMWISVGAAATEAAATMNIASKTTFLIAIVSLFPDIMLRPTAGFSLPLAYPIP
jgi:hypothetical protein